MYKTIKTKEIGKKKKKMKEENWIWHSMAGHVPFQVNIEVHCPTAIWSYWKRQRERREEKFTVYSSSSFFQSRACTGLLQNKSVQPRSKTAC